MTIRPGVTVAAPPSKSLSHRKIIAAALARGVSALANVLESDDITRTMEILSLAGAGFVREGKGAYTVTGTGGSLRGGHETPLSCYLHESGTSARLLTAVLAAGKGAFYLHGAPRLHDRPMGDLFSALEACGADLSPGGKTGKLPVTLRTEGLAQKDADTFIPVSCDVSSQYLSGMLLAAPLAATGLRLLLAGGKTVSWPYVSLTLQTMEEAGCPFTVEILKNGSWQKVDWRACKSAEPGAMRFIVPHGGYAPLAGGPNFVEGDYSGASYLLAAGALGPEPVTVTGLSPHSLQGDAAILGILSAMGADVSWREGAVTVAPRPLKGVCADMGDCPDLVPTVAVLAAFAAGETRITGAAHLTAKESDRLAAPAAELAKIGCAVTVLPDGLVISPGPAVNKEAPTAFSAHNDHRMAMSLALLERAGFAVALDAPGCVAKSFPEFWSVWETIHPASRIARAVRGERP